MSIRASDRRIAHLSHVYAVCDGRKITNNAASSGNDLGWAAYVEDFQGKTTVEGGMSNRLMREGVAEEDALIHLW